MTVAGLVLDKLPKPCLGGLSETLVYVPKAQEVSHFNEQHDPAGYSEMGLFIIIQTFRLEISQRFSQRINL